MTVELLYFDGCPSYEALLTRVRTLLAETGVAADVRLRCVRSANEAERERFLGSPTLRIDGRDIDPAASERTDYGLKCRLYANGNGLRGMPPDALILEALASRA